jgi:hypothetical protein
VIYRALNEETEEKQSDIGTGPERFRSPQLAQYGSIYSMAHLAKIPSSPGVRIATYGKSGVG